ncbi:hypothetical protein E3E14_30240 [Streptomyces sp. ICN441]|uniref:hypothetical protein n=1 Tax=Streptomyces sp. ICN441 TaxID=2558286 RepID=UPI00106B37C4|nr:hypothetical protein [Streptomyces sp. ICN441]TFE37096.1 hypothetical protein E3E14_30240 [Streptomyces sp. ICN441]
MSNSPGARPGSGARPAAVRRPPYALVALLIACLAGLGVAAPPATAADGDLIKVFVVRDPARTGGSPVTLGVIARSTLGDEARAVEIFTLNRGLAQRDGDSLDSPDEALRPGWILRLPADASGPGVQLARNTAAEGQTANTGGRGQDQGATSAPADAGSAAVFAIPLATAVAVVGAFLLALVTAGIMGRRRLRSRAAAVGRAVHRLGAPARRRRRLAVRRATGRRFATDADSVRRAYGALGDFTATPRRPEVPVHALRVDDAGVHVWLEDSDTAGDPWTHVDGRWRRNPTAAIGRLEPPGGATRAEMGEALLVRVGTDRDNWPVFVDLSRLDGVLSVTGDPAVARDVVQNLLAEVARNRPETPVTVLGADGSPPPVVPPGLRPLPHVEPSAIRRSAATPGTVRSAAYRRPVRGLVVVAGTPGAREKATLEALCGPGGAGWTGLVYGDVVSAHWRWHADDEGKVEVPVFPLRLTVPA